MLGKTHVAVGVSTSLAITHPNTISGVIAAVAGGAIGGWFCDIDLKKSDNEEVDDVLQGLVLFSIVTFFALFIDFRLGNGICEYIKNNWGFLSFIGAVLFICGSIYALFFTTHRSFTHSILGLVFFTFSIWLFCKPLAVAFGIGYLSHIVIDLPNKTGMMLFFPIKKRFSFGMCDSDKEANRRLMQISTLASFILIGWFSIRAFPKEDIANYHTQGKLPFFSIFQWYLIIINIISFITLIIDHHVWEKGMMDDDSQDFIHTIENLFVFAGGGLGMLMSFIILREKIGKHNATWYAIVISGILCWIVIYFLVCNPLNLLNGYNPDWHYHIPLISYLGIINLISFVLFIKDSNKMRNHWDFMELFLFAIGLIGGAVGGYLVIIFNGKKKSIPHFATGFPIMIMAHSFIVGYLLISGVM